MSPRFIEGPWTATAIRLRIVAIARRAAIRLRAVRGSRAAARLRKLLPLLGHAWTRTRAGSRASWRRFQAVPLRLRVAVAIVAVVIAAPTTVFLAGTGQSWERVDSVVPPSAPTPDDAAAALEARIAARVPSETFVVVDQTHNRLALWQDRKVVLDAVCSAGSGVVLTDGPTGRKWVFDTPRGRFSIRKKVKNPVWTKPDWAFIEEGKRPPRRAADRVERGVLGEYAMHLGDGYMIHGTLYERLLGRSVTHGCIRLGRDDLRTVFQAVEIGTPVFIF